VPVPLCFGDVELDLARRELRRSQQLVPIEPQVFDVLAYLISHRDRLVTRDELLDNVWGDRFVSDSTVTTQIKSARRAVGDSGADQRVIRTVSRRGFRFVAEVRHDPDVATPAARPPRVEPLIGRDADVDAVVGRLEVGSMVVLTGAAGVGKSRILGEVARRWSGPASFAYASTATRTVPFGALAPLLPPEIARIGNGDRLAVLRGLTTELEGRSGSLLVVDDAHHLDELSAAVVQQAVSQGSVAVVATARSDVELPEGIRQLRVAGRLQIHDVPPLSRDATRHLVEDLLGGPGDPAVHAELWRSSQGNPLLLRELVMGAVERTTLRPVDGVWTAAGSLASGEVLADLIRGHYDRLGEQARRGLESLAVAGALPLALAERLVGAEVLELLERSGALRVHVERRRHLVRFAHPLHAEAIEATLGLMGRRRAARILAEELERSGARRREDAVPLALWRLQAGQRSDTELVARAAQLALAFYDYVGAEALAEAAWDATGSVEHAVILAEARFLQGKTHQVEDLLAGIELAGIDDRLRTGLAVRRASNLVWGLGRTDEALELNAAAMALTGPGPWLDELTAHRATLLVAAALPGPALELAEPLGRHPTGRVRIEATFAAGRALLHAGRPDEARRAARQGYADHLAAEGEIGVGHPAIHLITYAQALVAVGRVTEGEQMAANLLAGSREARMHVGETWAGLILGEASLLRGDLDGSVSHLATVVSLARRCGLVGHLVTALASGAMASALAGDLAAARRRIAELSTLPVLAKLAVPVERSRARVDAAEGRLDDARLRLENAADRAMSSALGWAEASVRHDLVRLGAPDGAVERLAALAVRGGRLVELQAAHAAAVADHDPVALARAAEGFAELGATLFSAECDRQRAELRPRPGQP
jgi:DNA-binding winged helix-turn-helix (wHTH) protein